MIRFANSNQAELSKLLNRYGLRIELVKDNDNIPGSYWKGEEAGLIGNILYIRADTPIHSILHEACHYICMTADRRINLDTNAGGDYTEENAVCFLQILLADQLTEYSAKQSMVDMDQWGYSFRLGSADKWFNTDAEDAQQSLIEWQLINKSLQPTYRLR